MEIEARLRELGLVVPDLVEMYARSVSGARFVSHKRVGGLLYLSGTVPYRDGLPYLTGVVGTDLTLEQGYEAARYAALTSLSALRYALGDLDRVDQIVTLTGYVNSAPGFNDQPRVINGATDLLVTLYGERGRATRAAIGCQGLGLNSSVEVIITATFAGDHVNEPLPLGKSS
jgi:enamine deaminase RidA (YjgF/YER057c/UK114 family)